MSGGTKMKLSIIEDEHTRELKAKIAKHARAAAQHTFMENKLKTLLQEYYREFDTEGEDEE